MYNILNFNEIEFETFYHAPVTTVEEADKVTEELDCIKCKNLLLKNKKGELFLLIVKSDDKIDLKLLGQKLGIGNLSFANLEKLSFLNVHAGGITPFCLFNDKDHLITVLIKKSLIDLNEALGFHPMRNDATTIISCSDLIKFIRFCKNRIKII